MGADHGVRGSVWRRLGLVALTLTLGIGVALPTSASVIEKISLKSLQKDAEVIAVARVISSKSVTRAGTIQTKTVLAIERSWRGPTKGKLNVITAGGRANGLTLIARGEASFTEGQRVLVFLYRNGGHWRPVGMFQGVWQMRASGRVERDEQKTPPTQDLSTDRAERMLVWPSNSNGAHLVAIEKGPYAVDGGPRLISELLGNVMGGGR